MNIDRCDPPSAGDCWVHSRDRRQVRMVLGTSGRGVEESDDDDKYFVILNDGTRIGQREWVEWAARAQLEILD